MEATRVAELGYVGAAARASGVRAALLWQLARRLRGGGGSSSGGGSGGSGNVGGRNGGGLRRRSRADRRRRGGRDGCDVAARGCQSPRTLLPTLQTYNVGNTCVNKPVVVTTL